MGQLRNFITPLHTRTKRDYLGRMMDDKVHCMEVAKEYGEQYWDGDRRYGYGGYRYDGRWAPVARALVDTYGLGPGARVLDVGCGKAHLLYEISLLLPDAELVGFDVSEYALRGGREVQLRGQGRSQVQLANEGEGEQVRSQVQLGNEMELRVHCAEEPYPYGDKYFDLVISLMTLHNLPLPGLERALREMERVARAGYVAVESYRNSLELFNLECWALTCESFLRPEEWRWVFEKAGYTGDFEFAFFE